MKRNNRLKYSTVPEHVLSTRSEKSHAKSQFCQTVHLYHLISTRSPVQVDRGLCK
jgi:hypothetical protein